MHHEIGGALLSSLWDKSSRKRRALIYIGLYTLAFFISFLFAYSIFLETGKSFIWSISDGRTQHYPVLTYIGRYLRQIVFNLMEGKFSIPLFDINLGLGSDVISTLNYYGFGDPLTLSAALVPTKYIEYLYNALILVRFYLSGLTFSVMCFYFKRRADHTLIGTLIYVFSGFAVMSGVRHPFFINPMVQLPLLVVGIDQTIRKQKTLLLPLAVFYSALCGFYFLYMMTILLAIYVLVQFFEYYPRDRVKEFFCMAGRIIKQYCWGIGLGAMLFLPAVIGLLTSSRAGQLVERDYFSYGETYYFNNLLRVIAPPASWDALSLAAIVLFALVLLCLTRKRYRNIKIMLLCCFFLFVLPLGGYLMNGFSYPSQRWTFGLALLLSYIVVEMLPILLTMDKRKTLLCLGVLFAYSLIMLFSPKYRTDYHIAGAVMLGVTLCVLLLFKADQKRLWNLGVIACALLVAFNVSVNAIYKFSGGFANYVSEFSTYGTETSRLENVIEREAEPYLDATEGRFISSSFAHNVSAVWHIPSTNFYWSVNNSAVADFWMETENIGMNATFRTANTDQRTATTTLFSAKYAIEPEGRKQYVPFGYELLETTEKGNGIYENQYALPWGYTYDSVISYDTLDSLSGLEKQEAMLQSIALEEAPTSISALDPVNTSRLIPCEVTELKDVTWDNGVLNVQKNGATMTLSFDMPAEVEGYVYLAGFNINESGVSSFSTSVTSHGVIHNSNVLASTYTWYFGRENHLFNLGYSEEARTTCTIKFPTKGTYKLDDIQVYIQPMENYPSQVEALREEPLENIEFSTNKVTGTVDLSSDKVLCLSVPYSTGWSAKVDGEKVEIQRGNYMFMAIPLEKGYHEIEFTYCTPGLRLGALLSSISLAALVFTVYQSRKKKKLKPKE